ncbi:MAG: glycogen/starch/alpha-glucan family phosphorylase [Clostridia bacterium]|nr:glycogen/starch/alpha-glucan family phosphorylase [Clostridia bacterium]
MFDKDSFLRRLDELINTQDVSDVKAVYNAVSQAAMAEIYRHWKTPQRGKRCGYFSAEFLIGRAVFSNLMNLGILQETKSALAEKGLDLYALEEIEDAALGNGGLGRLAACFLECAATHAIPMDGYGLRYRYGLFKQSFENGFQKETADDWLAFGDPWSIRKEAERVKVDFADFSVYAVPYDTPVIGYKNGVVNTLRLWQSEPIEKFNFALFDGGQGEQVAKEVFQAESITAVLYPNDNGDEGKTLRLRQEYFLVSASLQSIFKRQKNRGRDESKLCEDYVFQLNDTHPVLAIPECIRLLEAEGYTFETALAICKKTFCFTNHTVLAEALEKWSGTRLRAVIPQIWTILEKIQAYAEKEGICKVDTYIVKDDTAYMANLAVYTAKKVNGVAQMHTEILKADTFRAWYTLFPEKFINVTNGITPRRWFLLNNPLMAAEITRRIGDGWETDLPQIAKIKPYIYDEKFRARFTEIKRSNKRRLAAYIERREGIRLPEHFIFDTQVKRLHEYKRQLLNALSVLYIYNGLKSGELKDFKPTAFLFGAKSAPGYYLAKAVIKFINEIARKINADSEVAALLKVVFVQNYNVSYAEKIVCASDISEQISMAGMEASGTGNMKFMLNGTVTLGTLDGANVEICEEAGQENNYIFGATAREAELVKRAYDPSKVLEKNPALKKAVDSLVDGTFTDDGTGMLKAVHESLLCGAEADRYLVLYDFDSYVKAKLSANREYGTEAFTTKCLENMANAGKFSADRSVKEYAKLIWEL